MASSKSRRARRTVKLPETEPAAPGRDTPQRSVGDVVSTLDDRMPRMSIAAPSLMRGPSDPPRLDIRVVGGAEPASPDQERHTARAPEEPPLCRPEDLQLIECETYLKGAPPEYFASFLHKTWPLIEPLIEKACRRSGGRYDSRSIYQMIATKRMQLWLVLAPSGHPQAVMTTHIVDYPTKLREAQVSLVAGRGLTPRLIKHWLPYIAGWAKSQGAQVMYFEGRPGFLRWGPWKQLAVTAEIRI